MASTIAACLNFPEWQRDLLVFEVATVATRLGGEVVLAHLGALLSPLCKQFLAERSCKLKRFLDAAADFHVSGSKGDEVVTLLGGQGLLVCPFRDLPLEARSAAESLVMHLAAFEAKGKVTEETVHADIAAILDQADGPMLICQLGARLRSEVRQWLRKQARTKVHAFLVKNTNRYVVNNTLGSESVELLERQSPALPRKSSVESLASVSTTSGSSVTHSDPASVVIGLLLTQRDLAHMLAAAAPAFYED